VRATAGRGDSAALPKPKRARLPASADANAEDNAVVPGKCDGYVVPVAIECTGVVDNVDKVYVHMTVEASDSVENLRMKISDKLGHDEAGSGTFWDRASLHHVDAHLDDDDDTAGGCGVEDGSTLRVQGAVPVDGKHPAANRKGGSDDYGSDADAAAADDDYGDGDGDVDGDYDDDDDDMGQRAGTDDAGIADVLFNPGENLLAYFNDVVKSQMPRFGLGQGRALEGEWYVTHAQPMPMPTLTPAPMPMPTPMSTPVPMPMPIPIPCPGRVTPMTTPVNPG